MKREAGQPIRRVVLLCGLAGLLITLIAAGPASAGLRAGVATVDITPPIGGRMYGYGARGDAVSTGVADPLFAKVLVLADEEQALAIVTVDLGSFAKAMAQGVRDRVSADIGLERVLVIASHSHSTPTPDPEFPSAEDPWTDTAVRKIATAVVAAHRALAPARLGLGWGELDGCHNRRHVLADGSVAMRWANREGTATSPVDRSVAVVAVDTAAGRPLATLVNFACHPVVLGPENLRISADYPGAMMALVEAEIGGQAMFAQGAAGDLNPFWDKTPPAEGGFEQKDRLGRALAAEVIRVRRGISAIEPGPLSVESQVIRLEPRWDLESPEVEAAFRESEFGWIFERYRERFGREHDAEITTVVLGKALAFATFPGEFFVEHQLRLKASSRLPNTLFFGYCNGELGYFPTIRAAAEGGYGATEATIVEVGAGEKLVDQALIQLHYQAGWLHRVPRF